MSHRRLIIPVLVASLIAAACSSDPPPPPEPPGPSEEELAAQARADSIAREQARQDSIARAEAAAEAERERAMESARQILEERVFFDYDESALTAEARETLRRKVDILRASPAVQIRIEGHADERGSTEYNVALGTRRAESVREFLVGFGLDPSRFSVASYGEERPLVSASNEQAWAQNRRAEFVITAGRDQITPVMDGQDR